MTLQLTKLVTAAAKENFGDGNLMFNLCAQLLFDSMPMLYC